jgi:hypothetical protein
MSRQRHRSEGNGRGLTPSQPDDHDSAPPGRSEELGDRSSQIISPPPKPSVGVAGEPIGVYRPEDRLTLPALTAIIDAGGLRLRAIGERLKYDDQLRVAVLR